MSTKPLIIKTLPNGLRIAVVSDPRAATVTASVLVGVGSAFETKQQNGLSHFLEHLAFKGTLRRPNAKALLEEIESLGAITNAFTSHEYTGYWVKGNPDHIDAFVDILADIYQHSTLPESEIEKEKGVIIEEINMYEDMIPYKVNDVLFEILYGDHAMARTIIGIKERVASFIREDFISYRNLHYHAANTVIVISGKVTATKAVSLVKSVFGNLSKGKKSNRAKAPHTQVKSVLRVLTKQSDQAHLALAFRSVPLGHKDAPAIRVLSTILGKGMSSRLPLILRDELGAAYYASAFQESFVDQGIFVISAGIDKARLSTVVKRIIAECARLKTEQVGAQELTKAKEYSIGTLRLGLELTDDVAGFYGAQMVLGQKVRTPEEVIESIKKVTAKDVLRVAKTLFVAPRTSLAVVGPFTSNDLPRSALKAL